MKTMRLITRIQKLLQRPAEQARIKKLYKTVKALKEKQGELGHKLQRTRDKHERHKLQQRIKVLRAQRSKGAEAYHLLKAQRDAGKRVADAVKPADDAARPVDDAHQSARDASKPAGDD